MSGSDEGVAARIAAAKRNGGTARDLARLGLGCAVHTTLPAGVGYTGVATCILLELS